MERTLPTKAAVWRKKKDRVIEELNKLFGGGTGVGWAHRFTLATVNAGRHLEIRAKSGHDLARLLWNLGELRVLLPSESGQMVEPGCPMAKFRRA